MTDRPPGRSSPAQPARWSTRTARYGMDHDRYDWSMLVDRPPLAWPNGARLALCGSWCRCSSSR